MQGRVLARILIGALPAILLCSCSRAPRSVALNLSLKQGMERTMRITTEQSWSGAPGTAMTDRGGSDALDLSSLAIVYRFRVASVDAQGTARVESTVTDVRVPRRTPSSDALVKVLKSDHSIVTIDRQGRVLTAVTDGFPGGFSGLPRPPGSPLPPGRTTGDMANLLGALNGKTVSIGETWTTELPGGSTGIHGTLHWTLSSIAGTTARLEYTGRVTQERVPLPGLPPGSVATLSGDMGGYVALELETGWPMQGRSDMKVDVSLKGPAGTATRLARLRVVSRFEPGS